MTLFKSYVLYIEHQLSIEYTDECVASAAQFNIPVTRFKGFYDQTSVDGLVAATGLSMSQHKGETCCTASHIMIWKEIAELDHPAVVMEHDAIVKHDYTSLEVKDQELLFLGPRIFKTSDYEYPKGWPLQKLSVKRFEGTHAYAITPATARKMLEDVHKDGSISTTVDGYLGLSNKFKLKLTCADPPCVLAVTGNRKSFAFGGPPAWYNHEGLPGYKAGLTVPYDPETKSTKAK